MLHNNHACFVNRDINAFWQIYGRKPVVVEPPKAQTREEINDKWPMSNKEDQRVVVVDTAVEVREVTIEGEEVLRITGEAPEALVRDLVNKFGSE